MSRQRSLSASKLLLREWRSGELRIVLAALILAVAVVVGISAFVSALQATLEGESRRFLAADSVVSSRQTPPPDWRQRARDTGLSTAPALLY